MLEPEDGACNARGEGAVEGISQDISGHLEQGGAHELRASLGVVEHLQELGVIGIRVAHKVHCALGNDDTLAGLDGHNAQVAVLEEHANLDLACKHTHPSTDTSGQACGNAPLCAQLRFHVVSTRYTAHSKWETAACGPAMPTALYAMCCMSYP